MTPLRLIVLAASLVCFSLAAAQTSSTPQAGGESWTSQEDPPPELPHSDPSSEEEEEETYDYGEGSYEGDYLDLDSEEDMNLGEANRVKRKVIFGGGGGYSGVGRRGGGRGGDPYGRRRDNHNGPDYGQYGGGGGGSWPYGDYDDTTSFDQDTEDETNEEELITHQPEITTTPSSPLPTTVQHSRTRAYGIVRKSPADTDAHPTITWKGPRRREAKEKLSKALKTEIAQYALAHSTQEAVHFYATRVGRRLSHKKVDKFVQRYQRQQNQGSARN